MTIYEYEFKKDKKLYYTYFSPEQILSDYAIKKVKKINKQGWILENFKMIKTVNVGVSVMVENDKGELLMGKRSSVHSHGVNTWCTPGGHIEFGENLEDTCKREVLEEVGVKVKGLQFVGITNDIFKKENKHYVTLYYTAKYSSGKIKSTDELQDVGWYPKDNLPKPLFLCIKNYLKGCVKTK